ncbi:hypothetical protein OC834_004660 [Tilletia horrida]|uniref:Uncharacterized protein n=1 Tax=Tilletia horrida TaxID=155126 RepID=A0AAN6G885_9BASI|nr:hypothetical protein OC842_005284 [Tilletia horrida]KAK0526826.1 hypothetical protein OC834_004660 [Tilletia horrida]KAK0558418.1 hypothetical protein OC844_005165 [Tilletia horrida]
MPTLDQLPNELKRQILTQAARIDGPTAVKVATLAQWVRDLVRPVLDTHMRVLHVNEDRFDYFLGRLLESEEHAQVIQQNVRALAIDHASVSIFDDENLTTENMPNPEDTEFLLQTCDQAKLVFIDTTALHAFREMHESFANTDALTICTTSLPPEHRDWAHLPFPPASTIQYPVRRLHLCPLGADTLAANGHLSPLPNYTTHLAITCPIISPSDFPRHAQHEFLSRQIILPLLERDIFQRLIVRGTPHMLLRFCRNLSLPPRPFHWQMPFQHDEMVADYHDPTNALGSDKVRFRLWPAPDSDPAVLASQYDGNTLYPLLMQEWRRSANQQLDAEDAHRLANPPGPEATNGEESESGQAESVADGGGEAEQAAMAVDAFEPPFGAPWEDEEGDIVGVSEQTISRLEQLVRQYPQYAAPPANIYGGDGQLPQQPLQAQGQDQEEPEQVNEAEQLEQPATQE